MGCLRRGQCEFIHLPSMQQLEGLSSLFRTRYCDDDHERCARHQVFRALGSSAVPQDMRPNDHETAKTLLGRVAAG